MNKKAKFTIVGFVTLLVLFSIELGVFYTTRTPTQEHIRNKQGFVALTTLGDLAISNEATFIRNRSISSVFEIFKDDPKLLEYFPSTFAISPGEVTQGIRR